MFRTSTSSMFIPPLQCRYFLRKLRKVKKANGEILSVNEVRSNTSCSISSSTLDSSTFRPVPYPERQSLTVHSSISETYCVAAVLQMAKKYPASSLLQPAHDVEKHNQLTTVSRSCRSPRSTPQPSRTSVSGCGTSLGLVTTTCTRSTGMSPSMVQLNRYRACDAGYSHPLTTH